MNSITELLDLEDADIFISDISISGTQKFLTIETRPETHFCPICGFKMHSRGLFIYTTSFIYCYYSLRILSTTLSRLIFSN